MVVRRRVKSRRSEQVATRLPQEAGEAKLEAGSIKRLAGKFETLRMRTKGNICGLGVYGVVGICRQTR
jgi:hypothetical protein